MTLVAEPGASRHQKSRVDTRFQALYSNASTGYTYSANTRSCTIGNSFVCVATTGRKYWFRAAVAHPSARSSRTVTKVSIQESVGNPARRRARRRLNPYETGAFA